MRVTPEYLERIAKDAEALERLHRELLPERPDLGAEGFLARISPYPATVTAGETIPLEVEIRNPFPQAEEVIIHVVAPQGWKVAPIDQTLQIAGAHQLSFKVAPPAGLTVRRARLAIDITIAGQRFGQQAEILVTVVPEGTS